MKVALVLRTLDMGGIEKSAVNLINECFKKQLKIDLFLLEKKGALLNDLNPEINVYQVGRSNNIFCYSSAEAKKKGFLFYLKRSFCAAFSKLFSNKVFAKKYLKKVEQIEGYDAVISYQVTADNKSLACGASELVLNKFKSDNKILFIHSDFVSAGLNNAYVINQLEQYNKLIFVSKSCCENFVNNFDVFKSKSDYLYNFQNYDEIVRKAEKGECCAAHDGLNLISVARLSQEKAHLRTLKILQQLKSENYNFKYHIVGDGPMREQIREYILANKMDDVVVMHGNQNNPYGFIKSADLFLLLSYHEAAPMVIDECACLGTPIVTTNTLSSKELMYDENDVFENNESDILNGLRNTFSKYDKNRTSCKVLNNDQKFEKFIKIVGK